MAPDESQTLEECLEWRRECREDIKAEISSIKVDVQSIKDELRSSLKTNKRDISLLILGLNTAIAVLLIIFRG